MTDQGKHNAKFGSKYGAKIRKRYLKIDKQQRQAQECPKCGKVSSKRTAPGIFECPKCGKFAASAYFA